MEKEAENPADKPAERRKAARAPSWLMEWGRKLMPWAMAGVIGAGIGLYRDNIGNMKDISKNTWRNDQQDARDDRMEARIDRMEANNAERMEDDRQFQQEMRDKVDRLLKLWRR